MVPPRFPFPPGSPWLTGRQSQHLELSSYALATLTAGGGLMGYVRSGSVPSLVAGSAVGLLCAPAPLSPRPCALLTAPRSDGLGGYRLQNRQPYGIELGLLASVILGGSAIPRAVRLRKPVPILLSVLSTFGILTFGNAYRQQL